MIGILDFGPAGNVQSVANAFRRAGAKASARIVKRYAGAESKLDGLVIPGVGSFSVVPQIAGALGGREGVAGIDVPVLCICLGMQAMFEWSEESRGTAGLGVIRGGVKKLPDRVRLPQLGWNKVKQDGKDPLFDGIAGNEYFYFANSYAAFPKDKESAIGSTVYGGKFVSAVRKQNWWGVQFHPEKSGSEGRRMVENFARICREWKK